MKTIDTNKWVISSSDYYWDNNDNDFNSKEEAIKQALKEKNDMYVGKMYELKFEDNEIDVEEEIINQLCDSIDCYCSEESDYWYENISNEQKEELNNMIGNVVLNWIEKNNLHPDCYMIDDIEKIGHNK